MQLATLRSKHTALAPVLTERSRRVWAATEAQAIGHGGIALVERATGISRSTIQRGLRELATGSRLAPERTRKRGAGRKRATATDATLLADLEGLVEPTAPGDPESPLRWTSKSVRTLAVALLVQRRGDSGSPGAVGSTRASRSAGNVEIGRAHV